MTNDTNQYKNVLKPGVGEDLSQLTGLGRQNLGGIVENAPGDKADAVTTTAVKGMQKSDWLLVGGAVGIAVIGLLILLRPKK